MKYKTMKQNIHFTTLIFLAIVTFSGCTEETTKAESIIYINTLDNLSTKFLKNNDSLNIENSKRLLLIFNDSSDKVKNKWETIHLKGDDYNTINEDIFELVDSISRLKQIDDDYYLKGKLLRYINVVQVMNDEIFMTYFDDFKLQNENIVFKKLAKKSLSKISAEKQNKVKLLFKNRQLYVDSIKHLKAYDFFRFKEKYGIN